MQDKSPYNENGVPDGYWEVYHSNNQLHFKALMVNGYVHGQYESYDREGKLVLICNFINGETYGFSKHYGEKSYYTI